MAKGKHASKRQWLQRHLSDPFVKAATARGYRSRAAYKLMGIDDKDRFLKPGQTVVDLGAAPGSWTQVVCERLTDRSGLRRGHILALDLLPMAPLEGVHFIQGDFHDQAVSDALAEQLAGARVDVVLSDMAPNLSGIAVSDAARSLHLCELALDFAMHHLSDQGVFLVKVFQGSGYSQYVEAVKKAFRSVATRKPEASRSESAEVYLLARGPRRQAGPL